MGYAGVQLFFFRSRAELRFLREYQPESGQVDFPNVEGWVGAIVGSGRASLRDLKEFLTLEDAFDIWEVITVQAFNDWKVMQKATKK